MTDKLFMAPEGVFPITRDANGLLLKNKPATGFNIGGTIQGEGKMAGIPALFMRTSGCNLRCMWELPNGKISICDTPNASFSTHAEQLASPDKIVQTIVQNLGHISLLVISGGEPFLQADALCLFIDKLRVHKPLLKIAIESNGTILDEALAKRCDFFSLSPKLKNSIPNIKKLSRTGVILPNEPNNYLNTYKNINALQSYINLCRASVQKDFQLKFVISSMNEVEEIKAEYLNVLHGWNPEDIVLMPLGSTPRELEQTRLMAMEAAIKNGFRYSPRLQVTYFDGKGGV